MGAKYCDETAPGGAIPPVASRSQGLQGVGLMVLAKLCDQPARLTGGGAARSLYDSYNNSQACPWLQSVLSARNDERLTQERFDKCFYREKISGVETIELLLPSLELEVLENDQPVTDTARLEYLYAQLSQGLEGHSAPSVTHKKQIKLGLIWGSTLNYALSIRNGLQQRLEELGVHVDGDLSAPQDYPDDEPQVLGADGRLTSAWQDYLHRELIDRGKLRSDYLVPLGTQGAVALREFLGADFALPPHCPPVVFAGVTYPIDTHLTDSLKNRYEQRNVGGVAYGADGLRAVAGMIHNWLVPGAALRFVYFLEYHQDVEAAAQLRRTRLAREGHLEIIPVSLRCLKEFEHATSKLECVYFSWYSFERVFEASESDGLMRHSQILDQRWVVATTRDNCAQRRAALAVAADDQEIGVNAAELIHGQLASESLPLGHTDIVIPTLKYWIHERVAVERGLQFSSEVRRAATQVFQ